MSSDRSILERQMADVELRPFTLEEFHRRRGRRQRNRRITTTVLGVALLVAAAGGVLRAVGSGPDGALTTDVAGPGGGPTSRFLGTWESIDEDGSHTMEIQQGDGGDAYEILIRYEAAAACSGAPTTMTGTGQRETGTGWRPGLVELVIAAEVTCDDGSIPSFERGQQEALGAVRFVQDPVTGELIGPTTDPSVFDSVDEHSLEVAWRRPGSEPVPGDPSTTIGRLVDAVNAGSADAFISAFAPDGQFHPRGFGSLQGAPVPLADPETVAWVAVQAAWEFEAEVGTCRPGPVSGEAPGEHRFSASSDTWIECDVAARWTKLSLEITERWRFELRGARLVGWSAVPVDLEPAERLLPLDYPGLEAWEAWLATTLPEDAARLLNQRDMEPFRSIGCDDPAMMCGWAERSWEIDGFPYQPTNLIPYDPALADEIESSINEYLDER